ncbi:MAG: NAD(P)H-binding protein [Phycisphaerales bacterium]|nr:NAD(P)H-binding protein [Phycisphaerales bacterium]
MTATEPIHAVTGAFGYSGQYIARRLLADGVTVRTLTNSPARESDLRDKVEVHPLAFDDKAQLIASLRGASVLYNTYWVRFNHRLFKQRDAVRNTLTLFKAAREAGVRRVVHVSITNPSEESPLEYFSSKAVMEKALIESGLSHAILRPTVLFGKEDILINNIAFVLRRLPIFGIFGDGSYRLQPIHVDDLARLAVEQGQSEENVIIDAIGPETFTYRGLVEQIGEQIGKQRPIVRVPIWLGLAVARVIGKMVGDVIVTKPEIDGLMAGLLHTDSPPTGTTRLTDWAQEHADDLGRRYASELGRRKDIGKAYA